MGDSSAKNRHGAEVHLRISNLEIKKGYEYVKVILPSHSGFAVNAWIVYLYLKQEH